MSENPVIQYIRLTLIPCFARLFGKRRRLSSLCLLLTLLVCSLLLSCLCITFGKNLVSLDTLTAAFGDYISTHGITEQNQPFRESVRTVLTYAEAEIYVTHVCFILLWLITSLAAVYRVFFEAVATEKYVYALYIIYGADTKLLRKSIIREFWVLGLPALIISVPLAIRLCADTSAVSDFSLICAIEMLALFFLLSLLCAHRITRRLFRESCVELMTAIDTSEYIESPRRISLKRTLRKKSGWGLALTAFSRMRTYRFTHALSVALIGAVLFSVTALTLPDNYATGDSTHEYTLTFGDGISFNTLNQDYLPAIESLEAVVATSSQSSDTADHIGTHMMLLPRQVDDQSSHDLLQQEDKWALDTVKIACGDGVTGIELGEQTVVIPENYKNRPMTAFGYTLAALQAGEAAYVYPQHPDGSGEPKILVGDTVEIAIPDGIEGYDRYGGHITVKVTKLVPVSWVYSIQTYEHPSVVPVCPRIYEDYIFLSPEDYGSITSTVHTQPISVTETFSDELGLTEGHCYLLLPDHMKADYSDLSHVTVISPSQAVKKPFTSTVLTDGKAPELPTDTYFINDTYKYAGIYLGKATDYAGSVDASAIMAERMDTVPDKEKGDAPLITQFRIVGKSYNADLSAPCVIFKQGPEVIFTSLATELSAMTLTAAGNKDKALYFMNTEAAVLSVNDTALEPGSQLFMTTDLPNEFVDAMAKAEVPLICPREDYQLTSSRATATFQKGGAFFAIVTFDGSSNLQVDRYPAVINGQGSYLPVGDMSADSIVTLSELDSMLVFSGDPKGERDNATVLQGDLATNAFTVMPEREAGLSEELGAREAILRLPSDHPYALAEGDFIHLAIAQPLTLDLTQMNLSKTDLLAYQIERLDHAYLPITLTKVVADPDITSPVLILSENTFCEICSRDGVISELRIFVDSNATLEGLSEVSILLNELITEGITLDTRHTVLQSHGTGSQRYPVILRIMLLPLCLLILLLTLSSARTLYLRREKERSAYVAAGEHRGIRLHMTLGEGLLSCLLSGGLYALLCPLFIFLLKLFCGKFHVPLMPESFSLSAFLFILGMILISAFGASLLSLIRPTAFTKPQKRSKKGEPSL
ncbi:MAG: hypothetical protein IJW00_03550 [Clostridia bacterium]|nr:hypothetical protein [Clostridia bacterium]